jgi:putative tricarboxylic transport membrane protein
VRILRGEIALALLFAALGALWLARAVRMPLWEGFAPDSGFLPLFYGVLLLALSLGVMLQVVRAPAPAPGETIRKPLVVLAALAAAVAALPFAGFTLTVFALLFFLYSRVERLPLVTSAAVSGVTTGVLYLVFKTWLGVPLP